MDNKFYLSISPDYRNARVKIFILLISIVLTFILFGICIEKNLINRESIQLEIALPIYVLIIAIITFLVLRNTYFKDIITFTDTEMEIPKMRKIDYHEVIENKTFTSKGFTSYIITLQKGRKLSIGPVNYFSASAKRSFSDFIVEFEKK